MEHKNKSAHPDTHGFFQDVELLKADLKRINDQYPDDPERAAEEVRKLWESE
ncbi:hypothetical protein [Lactobacillus sp. Sy-1]|uniref:hypothetical protein n=1 Tax=Lactobacillus sp. Sy-1 TaxID=2109645 RepID=UPI001C579624|nr:hypothetical protein [Lactobacillus sp. Sy-1]MBW1605181.1 hypothetical protein [Lactobacillus sp. Sy-1]